MTVEENLKHFHYHWFWGLRRYPTPQAFNIWNDIKKWQASEITLARQTQAKIQQKIWPLRAIYWLFNLSNYAKNYYQLSAYDLSIEPKNNRIFMSYLEQLKSQATKTLSNLKKKYNETTYSAQNFFKTTDEASQNQKQLKDEVSVIKSPLPSLRTEQSNAGGRAPNHGIASHNEQRRTDGELMTEVKDETSRQSSEAIKEEILVLAWMLPHLDTLGIIASSGQLIKFIELRKTYLQKALTIHPDKNPSPTAHQDFVTLSAAYKKLEIAFKDVQQETTREFSREDLWKTYDELHRDLAEIIRSYKKISESYKGISESYKEISESYKEISESYKGISESYKGISESYKGISESYKETTLIAQEITLTAQEITQAYKTIIKDCHEGPQSLEANELKLERNRLKMEENDRKIAETARMIDELTEKKSRKLASQTHSTSTTDHQESNAPSTLLSNTNELEPLASLLKSSFFNTLNIKGLHENYFSQLRKFSFPLFTSHELTLVHQILNDNHPTPSQQEPLLMICDKPSY